MLEYIDMEVEAYNTLQDLQGKHIPQFYSAVTVPTSSFALDHEFSKYANSPGILIQYISWFSLGDIALHAPKYKWQSICEEDMKIAHLYTAKGVRNNDVCPRNMIVHINPRGKFRIFMIDFGRCAFRRQARSEWDWWDMKADRDEEGVIGYFMENHLKEGFVYRRSEFYRNPNKKYKTY